MKAPSFLFSRLSFFFAAASFLGVLIGCQRARQDQLPQAASVEVWQGQTMGTYYTISFVSGPHFALHQGDVEDYLSGLNLSVSTYMDSSLISYINKGGDVVDFSHFSPQLKAYFTDNFRIARGVYLRSYGYLDPSVMPLTNYWGFGYLKREQSRDPDPAVIDTLLSAVGLDKFELEGETLKKPSAGALDFSAVAKGYGVDGVLELFRSAGCHNVLIDIGGEVRAMGGGRDGLGWKIGISKPEASASPDDIVKVVRLRDRAIATSGNYRNFYEHDGQKYVHTIDPHTGYTRQSNLLSVSVLASSCAEADAWATAFMSMGLERSMSLLEESEGMAVLLIYHEGGDLEQYASEDFRSLAANSPNETEF